MSGQRFPGSLGYATEAVNIDNLIPATGLAEAAGHPFDFASRTPEAATICFTDVQRQVAGDSRHLATLGLCCLPRLRVQRLQSLEGKALPMRLAVFALILLASTSVTFGDDLLVRKVSAALDKAKVCGFEVDEIRLAEAMNIATMAQSTQVRTIDENAPNVIEVPPPPPSASTGPAEAEEPEGPVLLSLGCQKLLKEFGPAGIVFAGLLRDERRISEPGEPLVPSRRVKVFKVGPDGKPIPEH